MRRSRISSGRIDVEHPNDVTDEQMVDVELWKPVNFAIGAGPDHGGAHGVGAAGDVAAGVRDRAAWRG